MYVWYGRRVRHTFCLFVVRKILIYYVYGRRRRTALLSVCRRRHDVEHIYVEYLMHITRRLEFHIRRRRGLPSTSSSAHQQTCACVTPVSGDAGFVLVAGLQSGALAISSYLSWSVRWRGWLFYTPRHSFSLAEWMAGIARTRVDVLIVPFPQVLV